MREWVGADKEVAEKVEVKTEQQKATATDEREARRETTTAPKKSKKGRRGNRKENTGSRRDPER